MILFILIIAGIISFTIYLHLEVVRKPITEAERIKYIKQQLRKNLGKEPEEWMVSVTYEFYLMFKEMEPKARQEIKEWLEEERRQRPQNKRYLIN